MRKFIIQCKNVKCKKPILKSNPVIKKSPGSFTWKGDQVMMAISAVDILTGDPVVMPNVYCRHCKAKNVFGEDDIIFTDKLDEKAKTELNEKVKNEILAFKNVDEDTPSESDEIESF